ncbi:hypothetical protein [Bacteroides caecicola]|uniref:hypothetical protein n=1 Tax=Bacteroides caecicola TaxID=1462569 RepID=UPI0020130C95|nr:hypothetical protein [Bacteroides caecicola]MCL1625449.1 hypothetical protein [Bacteroides caecicola]
MKKHLFLAIAVAIVMSGSNVFAQNNQPEKKKLTPEQRIELQAKHIEQRLMLDENTSAKFIPLYKEYLQALQSCRQTPQKDGQKGELTDAQIKENLKKRLETQRAVVETKEKYLDKFSEILTARQLAEVFKAGHRRPMPFARNNKFRPGRPDACPGQFMHCHDFCPAPSEPAK